MLEINKSDKKNQDCKKLHCEYNPNEMTSVNKIKHAKNNYINRFRHFLIHSKTSIKNGEKCEFS